MIRIENRFQYVLSDLIHVVLADGKISKIKAEALINKGRFIENKLPISLSRRGIKVLRNVIGFRITRASLNRGLNYRFQSETALISGAGISGLAASFELRARGFKVVIAEKRGGFSRSNIINCNVEIERFLDEFDMLEEFKDFVAARIKRHRVVHVGKKGAQDLVVSDVRTLQLGNVSFERKDFDKLFTEEGVYSLKIQDLQTFLAKKALEAGVQIFGNVEVEVLSRTEAGGVSKVQIKGKEGFSAPMILQPDLFFIAEGAHSTTAERLGMETRVVKNECGDEHWIYGNVNYSGTETHVVSIADTSGDVLNIANVIFNGKSHVINIAVTSKEFLSQKSIEDRLLGVVQKALDLEKFNESVLILIECVKHPVHVKHEKRVSFSKENIFFIGDAAGHSSPLAGLGGTLALTLIPRTVKQLLNDRVQQLDSVHNNFERFSNGYISRWMEKSEGVKKHCLSIFNKDRIPNKEKEPVLNKESALLLKEGPKDEN